MKIYVRADWFEDEIEPFLSADPYVGNTGFDEADDLDFYGYSEYEDFYKAVLRRRIYVPLKVSKDIPDYNSYRKALFNTLFLSMKSGESIESVYDELCRDFPGIMKDYYINESDMLLEIVDAVLYAQNLLKSNSVA